MISPLISIIIPTRNRKESLERTIRSVLDQTVECEVICIDDASLDGTASLVSSTFPAVILKRNETNVGPTVCRNEGGLLAKGQFLVTLDDDCVLAGPDCLATALRWFDLPEVGAVTLPFVNMPNVAATITAAPDSNQVFATSEYNAGMIMFRRSVFISIGGYRTAYFMHHEEADLVARLMNAGWLVRNGDRVLIHHHESPVRDRSRLWQLGARNAILYAMYNVPGPVLSLHLFATILKTATYALKRGGLRFVIKGFQEAVPLCWCHRKDRNPISWKAYRVIRWLRRRGPQPIGKVKEMLVHA